MMCSRSEYHKAIIELIKQNMAMCFKIVLGRLEGDQNDSAILQSSETIYKYKRTHDQFCLDNFQVFLAYKVTQDRKAARKILNTTIGNNHFNECNRLLLLNQFENVYQQQSEMFLDDLAIDQKSIAAFYLLGQNDYSISQFQEFHSGEITILKQLVQVNNNKLSPDNHFLQLEIAFQEEMLINENLKLKYVEKFRITAYHFYLSKNLNLNSLLIEMNLVQMCKIMILPTDYYNEYYNAFEYTILRIFNDQQYNYAYLQCLNSIKFSQPMIKIRDKDLFMNAVHTGITQAIVNHKIHRNSSISEMKAGVLDLSYFEKISQMVRPRSN